jgi:hypothetical protein
MSNSDFNGDGRDDILWRSDALGALTNWLAQPNGGFVSNDANAWLGGLPAGALPILGIGDFNGDNRDDVLWQVGSQSVSISNGIAGNGGFSHDDPTVNVPNLSNWFVAGIGDFNGDGHDDVLWRHVSGALTNWLGRAGFGSDWLYAFQSNDTNAWNMVPTNWTVVGVGDFNGDNRDDIIWRRDDGAFTEWLGQPGGGFVSNDANAWHDVPTYWTVVGTGDFNGDNRDDVIWRRGDGAFTEWLGQANGGFVSNDANAWHDVPTTWRVITTGDYNGDNRDDVLWRRDDGALTNWLGQASGGFVSNDANAWHDVPNFWIIQPNPSGAGTWDY